MSRKLSHFQFFFVQTGKVNAFPISVNETRGLSVHHQQVAMNPLLPREPTASNSNTRSSDRVKVLVRIQ